MKLTGKLISKVLVLCGVSLTCTACYGVPMSSYMVNIEGWVTDEATGEPIPGIRLSSSYGKSHTTDDDGRYEFKYSLLSPSGLVLTVEDIDGPENGGEYETQVYERKLTQENFAPAGGKYTGASTSWEGELKRDFALTLKPQQENENE